MQVFLYLDSFAVLDQHEHDTDIDDNSEDMVIFKFSFTGSLNNVHRARVYDAIVAYSSKSIFLSTKIHSFIFVFFIYL